MIFKTLIPLILALVMPSICLADWHTIWDKAGNTWYQKWDNSLKIADSLPEDDKIDLLGRGAALGKDPQMSQEKREIFLRAQAALLAVPGYADYYDQNIRKSMDEEMAKTGGNGRKRMWDFDTLDLLPSPETVKVLGELLYDDRDPFKGIPITDSGRPYPNHRRASMALTRLGIQKAPVKNTFRLSSGYEESDVETWKLWYEQVKAGTRTFSFEGDETRYNLSGRTTVVPDGATQSRPDRKASSAAEGKDNTTSNPGSRTPVVLAALILLGILIFVVRQMQRRGPGKT